MDKKPLMVAVYMRLGSEAAAFILPDEREAYNAYMSRKSGDACRNTPKRNKKSKKGARR